MLRPWHDRHLADGSLMQNSDSESRSVNSWDAAVVRALFLCAVRRIVDLMNKYSSCKNPEVTTAASGEGSESRIFTFFLHTAPRITANTKD